MSRLRRLSPSYWVILGLYIVVGALWVSDLFIGWAPSGLLLPVLLATTFASSVYTVRILWKQSDHPAFHPDSRSSSSKQPAPRESESDR